uniref:Ubiquitin-like domain-containing protein n=1 Tax=Rhizophora mucronata TaxID=61149 RepID=A0A2P2NIX5_RHIMU
MHRKNQQILVQFPDSQIKILSLDIEATLTLHSLKRSLLFSSNQSRLSSFYFTLNGKPLDDSTQIASSHLTPLSTLVLHTRLPGGGGDGGATGAESRDCYLNMYAEKKPDKVDPNEQRLSKWLNCALSNEPLTQPCVIDRLGNVFNKEALVEAMLGKTLPKEFGYIKGLKDMLNIKLEQIPGGELNGARFHCPITGLEFNGKYKFFALKNCGHVLSAKALKEVKSSCCLVCHKEFDELDKIVINGSEEEVAILRNKMEEYRVKLKDKKPKKVKNDEVGVNTEDGIGLDLPRLSGKKHGITYAEKAVAKVEGNGKVEKVKGASDGTAVKRFKAVDMAPANATKEVYASIFTSSKKADFKETFTCRSLPLGRN